MRSVRHSFFVVLASLTLAGTARADVVLLVGPDKQTLVSPRALHEVVEWQAGRERLWLQLRAEHAEQTPGTRLYWIRPVPAPAPRVTAHVVSALPAFSGTTLRHEALRTLRRSVAAATLSQLWPTPFVLPAIRSQPPLVPAALLVTPRSGLAQAKLEVVPAAAVTQLAARFAAPLLPEVQSALASALGSERSFAVYSVDAEQLRSAQDGMHMLLTFPSEAGVAAAQGSASGTERSVTAFGLQRAQSDAWEATPMSGTYCVPTSAAKPAPTCDKPGFFTQLRPRQGSAKQQELRLMPAPLGLAAWIAGASTGLLWAIAILCSALAGATASVISRKVWPANARPSIGAALAIGSLQAVTVLMPTVVSLLRARRHGVSAATAGRFIALSSVLIVALLFALVVAFAASGT